ncbi:MULTISPECIES: hypothetical protein [Halorussus]|uniref:hypothetical protein n=1 Tax=Halorussus TaxID=1070314 RepID=UPI00209DE1B2|nr:hypothetical protein [Halorussus vallis]USZ74315.1 hypothetical protein NGM07_12775 [Halorussus vallis]
MIAELAREEDAANPNETALEVSEVETARVEEYVEEWFEDEPVYFECKGEETFLVVGE